jgi:hypothetical protein
MARAIARRRAKPALSLAMLAGFAPTAIYAYNGFKQQGLEEGVARMAARLTGYSFTEQKWKPNELLAGMLPLVGGAIVHKIANRVGINRQLRKLTMGFISI